MLCYSVCCPIFWSDGACALRYIEPKNADSFVPIITNFSDIYY